MFIGLYPFLVGSRAGAAVDAARWIFSATTEIHAQVAQGRAQALLDHRVIEGHLQRRLYVHAGLHRPRQQMREMLAPRRDHLRAEQTARGAFAIDAQQTAVLAQHPGAALIGEIDLSRCEVA